MNFKAFLQAIDEPALLAAIAKAERSTTGEIRVCVARTAEPDPLRAARRAFDKLGMQHTRDRNGVLILVAPLSQTFAILGDAGIDTRAGEGFWDELTRQLSADFAAGRNGAGLEAVIRQVGEVLAAHFPRTEGDTNELPDSIAPV